MKLKEINKLPWPENLLRRIFMDEEYAKWKAHIPPDFDASFQYILEETLTEGGNVHPVLFLPESDAAARNWRTVWNQGRQVCSN